MAQDFEDHEHGRRSANAKRALLVLLAVPNASGRPTPSTAGRSVTLSNIYRDPRFRRLAPLSTLGNRTSWSLQGLWAAPWLRDVAGLDRPAVVYHLGTMAIALSVSALLLGVVSDRLRRAGVRTEIVLASTLSLSMTAQLALIAGAPLPSCLLWVVVAAAGAATVLSYASLASYFPREASGRANAALNLLHMGGTFILQTAIVWDTLCAIMDQLRRDGVSHLRVLDAICVRRAHRCSRTVV